MPRRLIALVAAGIALRLGLIAAGGPPERFEYDDLARNLLAGNGYVYYQLGTPYRSFYGGLGYMAITIATDWLFPAMPKAMAVVQSLYAGVLAVIVFAIARRAWSERLSIAAAALVLFHPALVYYDTHKLHPLGFDSLLMMTAVLTLLRLRDAPRPGRSLIAGLTLAFALLQRGSMALFLVASLVWTWKFVARGAAGAKLIAAYVAGVMVVLAPWAARNYAIQGTLMLESMTPQQLWKGNARYSNGAGYLADGRNVYEAAPESLKAEIERRDERGQFDLFRREAWIEMRSDPARAMGLFAKKFFYFWTAPPNSGQLYPAWYFTTYFLYYCAVVVAAAIGLAALLGQPRLVPDGVLVLLYFASLSVVHAIMFVEMRHRWAAEPLLLALAPAGFARLWNRVFG